MAVSLKVYSHMPYYALRDYICDIGLAGNTIKCMLCTSSYTPNQDDHCAKNQVTNEVVGGGYTAGGATLSTKVVSISSKVTKFDAADVSWAASTITARYAVVYDNEPAEEADKVLLFYVDFGEDESSISGIFTIQWNASGIFTFTVA